MKGTHIGLFAKTVGASLILGSAFGIVSACSKGSSSKNNPPDVISQGKQDPANNGVVIHRGIPSGQPTAAGIDLGNGLLIPSLQFNGKSYVQIHATYETASFKDMLRSSQSSGGTSDAFIANATSLLLKSIREVTPIVNQVSYPEVGYVTGFVALDQYPTLASLKNLPGNVIMAPVVVDSLELARIQDTTKDILSQPGLIDKAHYSGLERMGVPEFAQIVGKELNQKVDGSLVTVGVADTGITLNHPAFNHSDGTTRISYLKDFTEESRIYVDPNSTLEVKEPQNSDLKTGETSKDFVLVKGDVLVSPPGQLVRPLADQKLPLDWQKLKVSAELKARLLDPNSKARLALLKEDIMSPANEPIDFNLNGKTNDAFLVLAFLSEDLKQTEFFVDLTTTGDFTKSVSLKNFNTTKSNQKAGAEKFGLAVESVTLSTSSGENVEAVSAGVVGFDMDNHGSHVAGIIAAQKTIANDDPNTLARGGAPAVNLMSARACGQHSGCGGSLLSAIDLSLNGAEIVNMSLGGLSPFNDGYGVEETIINRLTEVKNTLFVISAGNSGPGRNTVGSPSTAAHALSVGATATSKMIQKQYQWPGIGKGSNDQSNIEDFMLFFSSRGPNAAGGFKPNISAPGTELSAVQLNGAPGARTGLDVYWGTSMAAPAASGAAALLLDAVKRYNIQNPSQKLPSDALSLRKALLEGARAFDVESFNPHTGASTKGQYTWIDQGLGMVNLPNAWTTLKKMRDTALPSAVNLPETPGSQKLIPIALRYEPRVLAFNNPNGLDYSGARMVDVPAGINPNGATKQIAANGQGLWFKASEPNHLFEIQVARRLPEAVEKRPDLGDALVQLKTTSDVFELETVIYGSQINWLQVGSLNNLNCHQSAIASPAPKTQLEVIGEGALDPKEPGFKTSNLQVCLNKAAFASLKAGDHGALIKAYRKVGGIKESVPSFIIPVFVSVPHKELVASQGYNVSGTVNSFQVSRNYVNVPQGTTMVKVSLKADATRKNAQGETLCSGVELMALEAGNTKIPVEISPRSNAISASCSPTGQAIAPRDVTFTRFRPAAGIWDLHVFGRYNFADSAYTLKVDYAKVVQTVDSISGALSALNSSFEAQVTETTFPIEPSASQSRFDVLGDLASTNQEVSQKQKLPVLGVDGKAERSYPESVGSVVIQTRGAPGSDIDLEVYECDSPELSDQCLLAGSSGSATDIEIVSLAPNKDKFYVAVVVGYSVKSGKTDFVLDETRLAQVPEKGTLNISALEGSKFRVTHAFDVEKSAIVNQPEVQSGLRKVVGELVIKSKEGSEIINVPVKVSKP